MAQLKISVLSLRLLETSVTQWGPADTMTRTRLKLVRADSGFKLIWVDNVPLTGNYHTEPAPKCFLGVIIALFLWHNDHLSGFFHEIFGLGRSSYCLAQQIRGEGFTADSAVSALFSTETEISAEILLVPCSQTPIAVFVLNNGQKKTVTANLSAWRAFFF